MFSFGGGKPKKGAEFIFFPVCIRAYTLHQDTVVFSLDFYWSVHTRVAYKPVDDEVIPGNLKNAQQKWFSVGCIIFFYQSFFRIEKRALKKYFYKTSGG